MPAAQRPVTGTDVSPQDFRRFSWEQFRIWANYDNEKPAGWLREDWDARIDPQVLDTAVESLGLKDTTDGSRSRVRAALEPIVSRGLVRREGRFVLPPMVINAGIPRDWHAWMTTREVFQLAGGEPFDVWCEHRGERFHLVICDKCTAVSHPGRRAAQAKRSRLCRPRPAAPALGEAATRRSRASSQASL